MKNSNAQKKKRHHTFWVNNRQQPIDPKKYCSICRYQYSKRSNFLMHVKTMHRGKVPPFVYEQSQSATEPTEVIKQKRTYKRRKQFLQSDNSLNDSSQHATHDDQPGAYRPAEFFIHRLSVSVSSRLCSGRTNGVVKNLSQSLGYRRRSTTSTIHAEIEWRFAQSSESQM